MNELKHENTQLMREVDRLKKIELGAESVFKKQNEVLQQEIKKLKSSSSMKLKIELEEKNKLIDKLTETNSKLITEIQRLQDMLNNESNFTSSFN